MRGSLGPRCWLVNTFLGGLTGNHSHVSCRSVDSPTENPRLRAVREAHGLSLRHVARMAGVDPGYLSRVERGLQRPSLPLLLGVCRALGLKDTVAAIERVWGRGADDLRP